MISVAQILAEYLTTSDSSSITGSLDAAVNATTLTWTLGSSEGAAFPSGVTVLLCGSELVHGTISGDTISVLAGGRGALGTDAAAHAESATVQVATLYDAVGARVRPQPPRDNDAPSVWIQSEDEQPVGDSPAITTPVLARCFGGSADPRDAQAVYRLLYDRLHQTFGTSTTSGHIGAATQIGGGDLLKDPDVEWWFVAGHYSVTVG